jgi:hypothetical protein
MQLDRRGARASFGPAQGFDFVEPLGTALLPNGTRFAVGRSAAGQTRLLLLQSAGPVLLEAQPEVPVAGLIDGPSGAALLAGRTGSLRLHTLLAVQRGEVVGGGGFRFSPTRCRRSPRSRAAAATFSSGRGIVG